MTPARATARIQVAAQLFRTSVITAPSPRRLFCSNVASRMPMSAARSARLICGASSMARYSAGNRASAERARTSFRRASTPAFASMASESAYDLAAPSKSPPLSRISPICANDFASPGSSTTAFRKCSIAASACPFWRSTPASSRYRNGLSGELAIAAVYACTASSSRPARARSRARASPCSTLRNFRTSTRRARSVCDGSAASAASNAASASVSRLSDSST